MEVALLACLRPQTLYVAFVDSPKGVANLGLLGAEKLIASRLPSPLEQVICRRFDWYNVAERLTQRIANYICPVLLAS